MDDAPEREPAEVVVMQPGCYKLEFRRYDDGTWALYEEDAIDCRAHRRTLRPESLLAIAAQLRAVADALEREVT